MRLVEPADLEAQLLRRAPTLAGPVQVLSTAKRSGHVVYAVSASHLVSVDEEDRSLREISIPIPVTCEVEVDPRGELTGVNVSGVDAETTREARAYARSLIATGAVRGLPSAARTRRGPGPPPGRPTHEVRTDHAGRKVIRRSGFDVAGAARSWRA